MISVVSELLHGLAPIVGDDPRILILGNMPSTISLASAQYYGNPRNAFWAITAEVYGFDPTAPYPQRTGALAGNGVAVWDVLRSCRRVSSLDSAVQPDSMVGNDIAGFLTEHPNVEVMLFNGVAAAQNYRRLIHGGPALPSARLPSTSPAHTMRYADKLSAWHAALTQASPSTISLASRSDRPDSCRNS